MNRLRYRLEKGNQYFLGLGLLIGMLVALVVSCGIALRLTGEEPNLIDALWWAFLRLSDPGYLGDDEGYARRILGVTLWFGGVFGVTAFLISITTHIVTTKLEEISEFGSEVAFEGHTLIVGWNEKLFTLVEELLEADAHVEIVILGPVPKQEAERELDSRVFSRGERRRFDARRQVVYRTGGAQSQADLRRVAADRAKTAIVLSAPEQRGLVADVTSLRTCMALRRFRAENDAPPLSTVLEITDGRFRPHALLAGNLDPRSDAWVAADLAAGRLDQLPSPPGPGSGEVLTLVNSDELVSRAIAQCAIQPRLSRVLERLLSFEDKEFFIFQPKGDTWDRVVEGARGLDATQLPAYLADAMPGSFVCGIYEPSDTGGGGVDFSPGGLHRKFAKSPLVVLGETHDFRTHHQEPRLDLRVPGGFHTATASDFEPPVLERRPYRVLLLGENRRLPVLIDQFMAFTAQYEALDLELTLVSTDFDEEEVAAAAARASEGQGGRIQTIRRDYTDWRVLGPLLRPPEGVHRSFDSIVLLAHDCELGGDDVDARVILGVVMLRAYRSDAEWRPYLENTSVVAEVLDPRNVAIVGADDWIADVIVSTQYVSRFIAQVAVDHRVEDVYCELFDFNGREIYDRPATQYAAENATFQDAMTSAAARDEIAFGYTEETGADHPVIHLAPPLTDELGPTARLLLIAED